MEHIDDDARTPQHPGYTRGFTEFDTHPEAFLFPQGPTYPPHHQHYHRDWFWRGEESWKRQHLSRSSGSENLDIYDEGWKNYQVPPLPLPRHHHRQGREGGEQHVFSSTFGNLWNWHHRPYISLWGCGERRERDQWEYPFGRAEWSGETPPFEQEGWRDGTWESEETGFEFDSSASEFAVRSQSPSDIGWEFADEMEAEMETPMGNAKVGEGVGDGAEVPEPEPWRPGFIFTVPNSEAEDESNGEPDMASGSGQPGEGQAGEDVVEALLEMLRRPFFPPMRPRTPEGLDSIRRESADDHYFAGGGENARFRTSNKRYDQRKQHFKMTSRGYF
ncbi:hypothetical protein K432DRAFT_383111 [Lepidopterella palustris CBS 459.81]|uniref:Uncharacterized protein n=1 Tax=Lepidopterella palustris CBS 459.81 TaxID=1314670 RepID=A0A8E2E8K2_9PEZI|nr:hypothetical protein K432DRAFT_383111 [Lepidopterella palustris CBS 459.81]